MDLQLYMRNKFAKYIRPYFIQSECELCGTTDKLELHHIKQHAVILKETLHELNLDYKDTTEYEDSELKMIQYIMLGKQIKGEYLTVCMECHDKVQTEFATIKNKKAISNKSRLEKYLDSICGIRLFKSQQIELKEIMCECGLRAKTLGINTLKDYMKEIELGSTIIPKKTNITTDGIAKSTRYWEIISTDND